MPVVLPDKKIGIIVPSFNDAEYLHRCLIALYSCEAGASWHLTVVDDCSHPRHSQWLERQAADLDFSLLRANKRQYFTRSVNWGMSYAFQEVRPYFYFLLNSDTEVTPGWAAAIIGTHLELDADIIGATLLYPNGRVQHGGAYGEGHHFGIEEDFVRWNKDRIVPWVTGAAMALHKDVIETVGLMPFDPDKRPGQYDASDRNMCVVARQNYGFEVAVSANCIICHWTHQSREARLKLGHILPSEVAE